MSDVDIAGRSAPEEGRAPQRRNSAAARDSTEGWDAQASHPSVSAQSRMTGSSRVQFFEWRARSSRYPPTTATPARPRISSALVPVRDSLLPAFAACVGAALGALAPPVGCAMVPSDGRSISSGSMPGFGVAAALRLGAGLALDDAFPDGTPVAFGFTTDGARPVAPGLGAELGCAPGACVGSAEGATVWACVGSAAGAEDVSGAGAAVGPSVCSGAELGAGAGVGSGAGALLGSGTALGSGAEDGAGACVGSALGAADGAGFSVGAAEGAAVGDGAGLGSAGFWPHCSPSQFIVKLRYQMPP